MKIAACLITKNSEKTLEQCLESIRPWVDGIFVYDTGSTDSTLELIEKLNREQPPRACEECGAAAVYGQDGLPHWKRQCEHEAELVEVPLAPITVEKGEWRDDFSWARTQSYAMPPDEYDWILWLDDDDIILGAEHFRRLAATAPPEHDGFIFFYDYARDDHGNTICQLWRERLVRRNRGYTWKGVVHEVYSPPEGQQATLATIPPDVVRYIHNRPPDRYAPDRNLSLLRAEVARAEKAGVSPDPRTLAYMGTELMSTGQQPGIAEGALWLEKYLEHPDATWPDERAQVHHKLASCLRFLGQLDAAAETEFRSLRERDDWAETYVGLCESFSLKGDWRRAEHWAKLALATWAQTDRGVRISPLIINPLEFTFIPYVRLSEACINTRRWDEAQQWLEKAAEIAPAHPLIDERRALYEKARFEGELVQAVMTLREAAIRYDENLKALRLLEDAVPYVIQEHPEIVHARAAQRENCRHYLDPAEYRRWYSEEPKESTVTDDFVPKAGEVFHRVGFLEHGLQEQEQKLGRKPEVLDLGCNDFWVGAYLMTKGYHVDGVELNRKSYELALERAQRFRNGGPPSRIEHGDLHEAADLLDHQYDAVSLFEVIEHVPDVQAALDACERMLKPGGRVYISTPDGAYENGNIDRWSVVERKGHLRAIQAAQLAELLSSRGVVESLDLGQGLVCASYTPGERKGKVVFYAGGCWEKWHPQQAATTGLGGSETALVQVATRLGLAGWQVKVYADVDAAMSVGGVIWKPHAAWDPMEECDLMVVSRIPAAFDAPMRARNRALWCHDHTYPDLTPERAERITHVITLSEWERDRFRRLYPFLDDTLVILRNGITVTGLDGEPRYSDADRPFADRKPRCVYSSSADRGLDVLLQMWPRIRDRVADAELHVYYGWDVFDKVALTNPSLYEYKARVLQLVDEAGGEQGGVFMRGRLPQPELAREMQEARVWAYPTRFLETSCIGAMEARAAGLALVTSDLGALKESVGEHGKLIPWAADETRKTNETTEYQRRFVSAVVGALTDEKRWRVLHEKARRGVSGCDWSERIPGWEAVANHDRTPVKSGPRRTRPRKAAVAA